MRENIHTNQQITWESEWFSNSTGRESMIVGSSTDTQISEGITRIPIELASLGLNIGDSRIIDIGCGIGRNCIYLAQKSNFVLGVDYSFSAVSTMLKNARIKSIENVEGVVLDATKQLPIINNTFDLAIDSFTSTSVQGVERRVNFAENIFHALKPGGYLIVRAVSTEDENEKKLMQTHPGPDIHSSIWPASGKFQKNFSLEELQEMYNQLDTVRIDIEHKTGIREGERILATNLWGVFRKPVT